MLKDHLFDHVPTSWESRSHSVLVFSSFIISHIFTHIFTHDWLCFLSTLAVLATNFPRSHLVALHLALIAMDTFYSC
jgi:hypothetical protein